MPFETSILAAIPAVFNFAVKGTQTSFELQQVPEQTRALFETIASTKTDIINARKRRVAFAKQYDTDDFAEWDRAVKETEAALTELERLVEPARIDLRHNDGKISAKTRIMFVIKESKSLSATSHRLTLAHQRMSSEMMMTQMKHDRERSSTLCLHREGLAPPPYISQNNLPRGASDEDRMLGLRGITRSVSTSDVDEDLAHCRPAPRTRRTVIPAVNDEEDEFDQLLNRHQQARTPPPLGPLGPFLASVETLNRRLEPMAPFTEILPEQDYSAALAPVPRGNPNPTVSLLSLNRLSAMPTNYTRPRRRIPVSPDISPPSSPYQRPVGPSLPRASLAGAASETRARLSPPPSPSSTSSSSSSWTIDHLPALHETSSVRFELDATQEVHATNELDPAQSHFPSVPPVRIAETAERSIPTARVPMPQARGRMLPYPDHEQPRDPHTSSRQYAYPSAVAGPSSTSRSISGLQSTPHFFAGHCQPSTLR